MKQERKNRIFQNTFEENKMSNASLSRRFEEGFA